MREIGVGERGGGGMRRENIGKRGKGAAMDIIQSRKGYITHSMLEGGELIQNTAHGPHVTMGNQDSNKKSNGRMAHIHV